MTTVISSSPSVEQPRVRLFRLGSFRISSAIAGIYRYFLERVVIRLFRRPDIVLRCTYNTVKPSAEQVIGNYFQGLYLLGENSRGGLVWKSSPERGVITAGSARLEKSLKRYMKKGMFDITENRNFLQVILACKRNDWTWINDEVVDIYAELYIRGFGRSLEAWKDGELAAGLWGFQVGSSYSIMSMFHQADRSGSILLGTLVSQLMDGRLGMIDCGLINNHFKRFGARNVPVTEFTKLVVDGISGDQGCTIIQPAKEQARFLEKQRLAG